MQRDYKNKMHGDREVNKKYRTVLIHNQEVREKRAKWSLRTRNDGGEVAM